MNEMNKRSARTQNEKGKEQRTTAVILAGGIDAGNALEASTWRTWGLDVSSGVEERPGVKSAERLDALFRELRGRSRCDPST